jgi:uncharacterized repeat protein (TIGR01451 family)
MRTVIEGSNNSVSALSPQTLGGTDYAWSSWSDEGTQPHNILASASATYTAAYQAVQSADLVVAKTGALNGVATWTLSVSNQGPGAAEGVAVTDTLPSRVCLTSRLPAVRTTPRLAPCTATPARSRRAGPRRSRSRPLLPTKATVG